MMWGSGISDKKGKEIKRTLDNENIVLLNDMESMRMSPINGAF